MVFARSVAAHPHLRSQPLKSAAQAPRFARASAVSHSQNTKPAAFSNAARAGAPASKAGRPSITAPRRCHTVAFPTAFVAGNDVVADEPEKVDRVLKALRDAIAFRAENTDEAIQLTAQFSALDPAQVEADAGNVQILSLEELDQLTEDGTVNTWLSGMVDYFVQAGKLRGERRIILPRTIQAPALPNWRTGRREPRGLVLKTLQMPRILKDWRMGLVVAQEHEVRPGRIACAQKSNGRL